MKKRLTAALAMALLIALLVPAPVDAQTVWVYTKNGKSLNLRDEYTNKVIGHIPYGTKLQTDESKDAQTAAYVTYKGVSGYAKWEFLIDHKPPAKKKATATPKPASNSSVQGKAYQPAQEDQLEISSVGAYIQLADANGKGYGQMYGSVVMDGSEDILITADIPRGKKIDYWVINGVKYEFNDTVKTILLKNADMSFTFEVVYTSTSPSTLRSAKEIQANRTGERLEVDVINGKLCHLKNSLTGRNGAGGWITYFDFTDDFQNRANGEWEDGGQVSIQVKATVPKGGQVKGWKFNESELYMSRPINTFFVRTLDTSMTYEPLFRGGKKTTARPQEEPEPDEPDDEPDDDPTPPRIKRVTPTPTRRRGVSLVTPTPTRRFTGHVTRVTPTPTIGRYGTITRVTPTPTARRFGSAVRITPTPSPTPRRRVVRPGTGTVTRTTPTPTPAIGRRPSTSVTLSPSYGSLGDSWAELFGVTPTPPPTAPPRRRVRFQ